MVPSLIEFKQIFDSRAINILQFQFQLRYEYVTLRILSFAQYILLFARFNVSHR